MVENKPTNTVGISTRWFVIATTVFFIAITLAPPLQLTPVLPLMVAVTAEG